MKILVTGVTGQIGSRVAGLLAGEHFIVAAVRKTGNHLPYAEIKMELGDPASIHTAVRSAKPDAVIHAAAITSPETCNMDEKGCMKINLEGTRHLTEACGVNSARMIYLSTDLVFDGKGSLYTELDTPNPLSIYAESKLKGEEVVSEILVDHVIARTSIVFGRGAFSENGFTHWLTSNLSKGKRLELYTDQYRSHFYIGDCARAIAELLRKDSRGLYHLSSGKRESRYEFALKVAKRLSLDDTLLAPSKMEKHGDMAKRPKDCSLDNGKLLKETDFRPLPENEALTLLAKEYPEFGKNRD
ncbi:MAG: SDR family oxidoreductase [Nitrospinota bacterium]|nr:SDR family oxidoreductase [Nitrospinota bacterium]